MDASRQKGSPAAESEDLSQESTPRVSEHVQQPSVGVSFRHLSCHGLATSTQYQTTFASYILTLPRLFLSLLRNRKPEKLQILQDFDGLINPGEMLLVLGRPGSGCSTFLKTIAGDTHGFCVSDDAEINYQGRSYNEMHKQYKRERVYLAEFDVHFPELTLGQTLGFAASTRDRQSASQVSHEIASLFGLQDAFSTRIGNELIRGLSGGEKRRTSIAEAFVGGPSLQCWDNSTRGLDSSTARNFIRVLRTTTDSRRSTVCMSLYQASESMYDSFDKVTLLYKGRQIYFGPVESATEYFVAMGYVKPPRATTADFLTSITSPSERIVQPGYEFRVPRSPDEFAAVWRKSEQARTLSLKIDEFDSIHPTVTMKSNKVAEKHAAQVGVVEEAHNSIYALSVSQQVVVCLGRAFQRMRNNLGPSISGVVANSILGLIIGSVFYNLGDTTASLQQRSILLFFGLMINAFAPAIEVSLMWAQRPIVEKHHRYAFYRPFTERLGSMICDLPPKVAVSFGIHIPLYFLSNLRRTPSAFFVYWVFMFANLMTMSMLFRAVGSVSKTREETMTPVSIMVLLFTIYTGFVVPPSYMVPWFGWIQYLNPLAYTYESLMINELRNRTFACTTVIPEGPAYSQVPLADRICSTVGSLPGQQIVQGSRYLSLKYNYLEGHLWRNLGILCAMIVGLCVLHLLAAEYILAQPSRGEILMFRNKKALNAHVARDEESGASSRHVEGQELIDDDAVVSDSDHISKVKLNANKISEHAASIQWKGLGYEVKVRKGTRKILGNMNGWVKPGTLTALMGVTGAGKTTLLDVLADRTSTGVITGDVIVNGRPRDSSFQRRMGYVQQDDVHLYTATVREALEFSALLRQPASTPKEEKLAYIDTILKTMDMEHYADAVIGVPGEGLNVEQRKRLTIAVEMVAKPELLLFLDEPTSGLDSQTAWSICTLLRKLADSGQTILCTIHQPSSQIFCMFDRLLLLNRGGSMLYFGDLGLDASTLISYFEANGAPECRPGENPAEWVLNVTGNKAAPGEENTKSGTWCEKWERSHENQAVLKELDSVHAPDSQADTTNGERHREFAASYSQQMIAVSRRIFQEQWRDPIYLYCKITLSIGLALFNGFSFWRVPLNIQGVTSLLFSIFLITQLFSSIDRLIITKFVTGRDLFEARERNSKTYSWIMFVASNVLVEVIWQTLISVPVFASWYYATGMYNYGDSTFGMISRGALSFVLVWLFNLWATTLSQIFAAMMGTAELAMQLATMFFWLTLVFCGILATPDSIPSFWFFMYRVSPLTYFVRGLAAAGLANAEIHCSAVEMLQLDMPQNTSFQTCGDYLTPYAKLTGGYVANPQATADCQYCPVSKTNTVLLALGIEPDHAWRNAGIMAAYVVFNILVTFGAYRFTRVRGRKGAASAGKVN